MRTVTPAYTAPVRGNGAGDQPASEPHPRQRNRGGMAKVPHAPHLPASQRSFASKARS
ncbi:hypothetical protein [Pseudonocardia sp. T1-2H]|uniref:hypothetical protein n=1 Tax=Pseudonocardia sp. T1-2H TaxID=3128899 RepID=UPI003100E2AE